MKIEKGVEWVSQMQSWKDVRFDSKWEIYFYQYLVDNNIPFEYHVNFIKYYYENKEHRYYPDFKIYDRIVEIKSDYLYKYMVENKNTKEHSKYKCMIENNVLILQSEDIKLYEEWFYKHYDVNLDDYKINQKSTI